MKETLKLRRFGGSLGVIIPKNVVDSLALEEGEELHATVTSDGLYLTPFDPDFADALDDAREFMRSHRDAFRELSK